MVITGAVLIVLGIIFGAFGAHALKQVLNTEELQSFETGVRYQMYHGLAFLIVGLNVRFFQFPIKWFYNLILIGILLFSGSIYGLSLDRLIDLKFQFLGPITPIGGLCLIVGWLIFIIQLTQTKQK